MNPERYSSSSPAEAEQNERLVHFRLGGAWMGGILLLVGIGLMLAIFFTAWKFVRDPAELRGYVDRWEALVRGNQDALQSAVERGIAPMQDPEMPRSAEQEAREQTLVRAAGGVFALAARPLAIVVLIFVASLLIRVAIAITETGVRLMHLTVSEQGLLKRMVEELKRSQKG